MTHVGWLHAGQRALHTCTSRYAYAAMFGSSIQLYVTHSSHTGSLFMDGPYFVNLWIAHDLQFIPLPNQQALAHRLNRPDLLVTVGEECVFGGGGAGLGGDQGINTSRRCRRGRGAPEGHKQTCRCPLHVSRARPTPICTNMCTYIHVRLPTAHWKSENEVYHGIQIFQGP